LQGTPDRRIVQAAVINCLRTDVREGSLSNVPIVGFGKFFLTLPMLPRQTELNTEFLGMVTPGDGTLDFETVLLYR
jgi:hypothetical protein